MFGNSVFAKAFWNGLAAPDALFAQPAPYVVYVPINPVGQNFAYVGALMSAIFQKLAGGLTVGQFSI